jgi:hypothetical protein
MPRAEARLLARDAVDAVEEVDGVAAAPGDDGVVRLSDDRGTDSAATRGAPSHDGQERRGEAAQTMSAVGRCSPRRRSADVSSPKGEQPPSDA